MRIAAPQILVGEFPEGRGLLFPGDVLGGVVARAAAGLGKLQLAVPGDDDAAAPSHAPGRCRPSNPKGGCGGHRPEMHQRCVGCEM